MGDERSIYICPESCADYSVLAVSQSKLILILPIILLPDKYTHHITLSRAFDMSEPSNCQTTASPSGVLAIRDETFDNEAFKDIPDDQRLPMYLKDLRSTVAEHDGKIDHVIVDLGYEEDGGSAAKAFKLYAPTQNSKEDCWTSQLSVKVPAYGHMSPYKVGEKLARMLDYDGCRVTWSVEDADHVKDAVSAARRIAYPDQASSANGSRRVRSVTIPITVSDPDADSICVSITAKNAAAKSNNMDGLQTERFHPLPNAPVFVVHVPESQAWTWTDIESKQTQGLCTAMLSSLANAGGCPLVWAIA